MSRFLSRYFYIDERGSSVAREVLAGVSTYLSLAYIFIVNPAILGKAHMDPSAVLFATVAASGLTTVAMGVIARLPFAVAPGLEMNGFFAFFVVGTLGMTWQDALGAVFWSGVLYIVLVSLPVRQKLIDAIPSGLKINIAVSVGVFVAAIGLKLAGIVPFTSTGFPDLVHIRLLNFTTHPAIVLYVGLIVSVVVMRFFRFPGGMLMAIIAGAVVCKMFGIGVGTPAHFSTTMTSSIGQLHIISVLQDPRFLPVALTLLIVNFFGDVGKFIGLTAATNIQVGGRVPNMEKAFYVDGFGTAAGSVLGTSNLITYVESAVGIATGGRTGITAIVCGLLMLASLVFTPLVGLVPVEATAGVLLYVGYLLIPVRQFRESPELFGRTDMVIAVAMGALAFISFNLSWAMVLGFFSYSIIELFSKRRINFLLAATTIVLIAAGAMQYLAAAARH